MMQQVWCRCKYILYYKQYRKYYESRLSIITAVYLLYGLSVSSVMLYINMLLYECVSHLLRMATFEFLNFGIFQILKFLIFES